MGLLGNYLPDWLPEDPNKQEAARQGLLNFGAALLGGRGNFGSILGQGINAGAGGYQQSLQDQQKRRLQEQQQKNYGLQNDQLQASIDEPASIARIIGGGQQTAEAPAAGQAMTGGAPRVMSRSALPMMGQQASASQGGQQDAISAIQRYTEYGDRLASAGKMAAAKQYYELAKGLQPKLKEQRTLTNPDGSRVVVNVDEYGKTSAVDGFAPDAEKLNFQNTGGSTVGMDPFTGKPVNTISNTQSPDSKARIAADMKVQRAITARAQMGSGEGGNAVLPSETLAEMAQQYRAGDTSVMIGLGRGTQGPANIVALRNEITRQNREDGKGGADLAAQNAEYFGTKAGQRSAGTRIANVEMAVYEAKNLMPMARDASSVVSRSGLLPFGKAQVMFNEQTNDPAMRQFAAANNALVNVYSRAISPSGVPTVADKEHAREMISTAMSHTAYLAVVDQMERELTAAQAAPQQVRKAFNDAVTGKGGHAAPDNVPSSRQAGTYEDADKERRYQEFLAKQRKK